MSGLYLRHQLSLQHDTGAHPERADRIRAIEAELERHDWLGLELVEAPAATREQLLRVHSSAHVDAIEELSGSGGGMLDLDTVASERSFDAALRSAGGAAHAVDRLLSGEARFGFCGLRPPGHHAERDRAMGFCLFNNAAVAATQALSEHGAGRVFVLDWDVHHGNGTAAIFYDTDSVLYTSIHQSPLYPGTGAASERGSGAGAGYTLNLPVPPGAGGEDFLDLVRDRVVPTLRDYEPKLVVISAGYDAHRSDPLAQCRLEDADYGAMASRVAEAAQAVGAPILVCLEGGYELDALAGSVRETISALR
jgi:acetoin utilization deacetylase AcuC-like enzyme